MKQDVLVPKEQDSEEHWVSISDMMAGLMVIFLFIAISYMLNVRADKEKIEKIKKDFENKVPNEENRLNKFDIKDAHAA